MSEPTKKPQRPDRPPRQPRPTQPTRPTRPADVLVNDEAANARYHDSFRVLRASLNCDFHSVESDGDEEAEE